MCKCKSRINTPEDLPNTKTGMKAPDGMGNVVETADIQNCEMNNNVFIWLPYL